MSDRLTSLEICAGAGGQALGLEMAGFEHVALVEIDPHACETLRLNRPHWNVIEGDIAQFDGRAYQGIDLLAGGVPCPPFSVAGKQLGKQDERDLFPEALRLVAETQPRAVLLENVRGLMGEVFADYRAEITRHLRRLGYRSEWRLLHASDYGVPQLRPRLVLVAVREDQMGAFAWPEPGSAPASTVGETLYDLVASRGWPGANDWRKRAAAIAPTIVGGSKKHGGPDLGPTRAKKAWKALGVDGMAIAAEPPGPDFPLDGDPRLTVQMVARLQGFPDSWKIAGRKTNAYRQVGNAFPPPVARAIGASLADLLATELAYRMAS